ncbi:aspartate aminotransferase family protein [Rhizobium sp. BT03]|uniref:aspartate aminotransferase family protein n=1 Tax=Rhizobium sp. BT03 TaxID=3045156 RepID=UPI0024B3D36F|nr:aspartate aminotransferase family protein [Rhizobium sp. BT03]WHO77299.1 aspartate aminotransferase family protein [Rhizobium sp. BT03]
MTYVLHRTLGEAPIVASTASGGTIEDAAGNVYLDACGGAAVSLFGHANRRLIEAAIRQLQSLDYVHTSFFTNKAYEQLAQKLTEASKGAFSHALCLSGGSEAVEVALKIARQYFVEKGEVRRSRFITRRQSYHGNTIGALSVGYNVKRRHDFRPLLFDVSAISECNFYRHGLAGESEEEYAMRAARELDAELSAQPAGTVIGFIAETIGGATAGALTPPKGYLQEIAKICDKHGVLLILDEIMCGMGRSGKLFAFEWEGVRPDIATCGKALGGGVQPISAVLVGDKIVGAIKAGSGALKGGHTFMGHPVGCAVALEALAILTQDGFLEDVVAKGRALEALLKQAFASHPHVGDIRGRGLFWAIELVRNRATKEPFPANSGLNELIKRSAFTRGLLIYPGGGTVDGTLGDHVLLAPSATADTTELHEIVERLRLAVDAGVKTASARVDSWAADKGKRVI